MSQADPQARTVGEMPSDGPLATLFSSQARTRIIEAFVAHRGRELNVSDIARESDTSRSTVYRHIDALQEMGVVQKVTMGSSDRYTLNTDNDVADLLFKLEGVTLQQLLDVESEE